MPTPAAWVEQLYSRQFYLLVQNILTRASSLVAFAFFDLLLALGVVGFGVWWVWAICTASRGRRWRAVFVMGFNTVAILACTYLIFLAVWGLNYRRQPLTVKLDYVQSRITQEALMAVTQESIARLNNLHPRVASVRWSSLAELPSRMAPAFTRVQQRLGVVRTAVIAPPKATFLTPYFRRAGIDGMINPFLLEILINETVWPFERPFVVAHEWAHLAGYATESEASFVGWLICLDGDDQTRYSAWLMLTSHLLRYSPDAARADMWALMDEGPVSDLRAIAERLSSTVPIVRRNSNRLYDRYLKANRVEAGLASYGAVVDLVLGTWAPNAALP